MNVDTQKNVNKTTNIIVYISLQNRHENIFKLGETLINFGKLQKITLA